MPKLSHPIARQFNVNDFLLVPEKFDLLYVTDEEQFAAEKLGRFIKLRVGIVRTGQRIKNSEDIAEIIDHDVTVRRLAAGAVARPQPCGGVHPRPGATSGDRIGREW